MPKDVRGKWNLVQSNQYRVGVDVTDEDPDGTFTAEANVGGSKATLVDTRATDSDITFLARWPEGSRGRYVGRFDFQGRLTGITFDEAHPESQATWFAEKMFGSM